MVQMPRYINVEVTGCIGMAAICVSHLQTRHKEMSTDLIPTSPCGHRGNGAACSWMESMGGELGDAVKSAARSLHASFRSMNEEQKKSRGSLTSLQFSCTRSKQHSSLLKSAHCAQIALTAALRLVRRSSTLSSGGCCFLI